MATPGVSKSQKAPATARPPDEGEGAAGAGEAPALPQNPMFQGNPFAFKGLAKPASMMAAPGEGLAAEGGLRASPSRPPLAGGPITFMGLAQSSFSNKDAGES